MTHDGGIATCDQTSLFGTQEWAEFEKARVTGFQLLDRVQVKNDREDPLVVFLDRLRRFFGKDGTIMESCLYIPWARGLTCCIARRPEDPDELARGIVYIYRGVHEMENTGGIDG